MNDVKNLDYRYRFVSELASAVHILRLYFDNRVADNDHSGRYADWRYEAGAFDAFLSSLSSDIESEFLDEVLEFRLFDEEKTRLSDWFLNADFAVQIGFVRSMISYKAWKFSYVGWQDFIACDWFEHLSELPDPRYFNNPADYLMRADDDYLGNVNVANELSNVLDKGALVDHQFQYLNTDNEVVVVMQPYSGAVEYTQQYVQKIADRLFDFVTEVSFDEESWYDEDAITITIKCHPDMTPYKDVRSDLYDLHG